MASPFSFTASSTQLTAANLTKILDAPGHNMLTNGSFEDWDEGGTTYPYCWDWDPDSDVSQTVSKEGTTIKDGLASCKIVKPTGGAEDLLKQTITAGAAGVTFTSSVIVDLYSGNALMGITPQIVNGI